MMVLNTFPMVPLFACRFSPHSLRATPGLWKTYTHLSGKFFYDLMTSKFVYPQRIEIQVGKEKINKNQAHRDSNPKNNVSGRGRPQPERESFYF